jgi:hypothetical protein
MMPPSSAAPSVPADVSLHARLYGHVWRTSRTICVLAFIFFVAFYYYTVVPSAFELAGPTVLAEPFLLAGCVVCWRATGNIRLGIASWLCFLYASFALFLAGTLVRGILNVELIDQISRLHPDQQYDTWLRGGLGPHGPVLYHLGQMGLATLLLAWGAISAIRLRFQNVPGTGATILAIDNVVRREMASSGDAPRLLRLMNRSRGRGVLFGVLAGVVLLLPLFLPGREASMPSTGWRFEHAIPMWVAWLTVFFTDRWYAFLVCFPVALYLWRLAKGFLMPRAELVLEEDKRLPLLFLRSYKDDDAAVPANDLWRRLLFRKRRLEEVTAMCLSRLGPFITVGNPYDTDPASGAGTILERVRSWWRKRLSGGGQNLKLGAYRTLFGEEVWRGRMLAWIKDSRLIVLVAGKTPSVNWELRQACSENALGKVLLLFPPGTDADMAARWRSATEILEDTPWHAAMVDTDVRGALGATFRHDGGISIIRSGAKRERDYDLALRVGLHALLSQRIVGPSMMGSNNVQPPGAMSIR